ncbi:MAG: hypothetical protein JXB34_11840 [Bacteroidales bacterium]|nr:hypothetical protein [Bacteroidales bacterium]
MKGFLFLGLFLQVFANINKVYAGSGASDSTLFLLCDALVSTQITNPADSNYGALVCLSENPEKHPLHSRAAEAVYPLSVAYKLTDNEKYLNAAILLGNWLVKIQVIEGAKTGGWSENWPDPEKIGWFGTTADQLISLAGAYLIINERLLPMERERWCQSIEMAAGYVMGNFPIVNVNYNPTGAVALVLASKVLPGKSTKWLNFADTLLYKHTLSKIDSCYFLVGEGNGIDVGYNLAQSIGFIAMYGILTNNSEVIGEAEKLLKSHIAFVYPNGSVDNSWGTRSFKWNYESGTKTAPGVFFSFDLLADRDSTFAVAGNKCLEFLNTNCIVDGWVSYGPHAYKHQSCAPPCNYSTFARAQSIAMAIEYGKEPVGASPFPAQKKNWHIFYPHLNVAVVRTGSIMATVSAYGEISRYRREGVSRGGSITNLWYEGFGKNGSLQTSSVSVYRRIEAMHMPVEDSLLPLTPRIGFYSGSVYYSNIYEESAQMSVTDTAASVVVSTRGVLKDIDGSASGVNYCVTNIFSDSHIIKEYTVYNSKKDLTIVEPVVFEPGTEFSMPNDSTVYIKPPGAAGIWMLQIWAADVPFKVICGYNVKKYWCPFPGVEAFPIEVTFSAGTNGRACLQIFLGKLE